jgi:predicted alpha/beta hydrolase
VPTAELGGQLGSEEPEATKLEVPAADGAERTEVKAGDGVEPPGAEFPTTGTAARGAVMAGGSGVAKEEMMEVGVIAGTEG